MIPTLSLAKFSIILLTICLALSKRLGAMSSANILFDTSKAKTISTPCRFTVSNLVPIFGLAKAMINKVNPKHIIIIFKNDLNVDLSGISFWINLLSANCFCFLFFHKSTTKNITNIAGIMDK